MNNLQDKPKTYYHEQLIKINATCYLKDHIYGQVVRAKNYMDINYNKSLELSDISKAAFFSKYHFTRLFKQSYGRTPNQYLTEVRIKEAKKLLKAEKTVFEVCHLVGFNSVNTFSGLFKRITGNTPSEYQKKQF